jgi:hypothetical protein
MKVISLLAPRHWGKRVNNKRDNFYSQTQHYRTKDCFMTTISSVLMVLWIHGSALQAWDHKLLPLFYWISNSHHSMCGHYYWNPSHDQSNRSPLMVSVLLYWLRKSNRLVAAIQNDKASLFVTNGTWYLIKYFVELILDTSSNICRLVFSYKVFSHQIRHWFWIRCLAVSNVICSS